MADYDPMNPVHAGPKSPKIKATIRGGGYTSPKNDEKPVEGIPIRRYSWDDIERMENTFVPPHLFEASGGHIRTELDMYTFQASGGKADLPDYPRIKPHEYRLGIPNFNEDLELRLAKAGARARRGEFIKDRPEPLVS